MLYPIELGYDGKCKLKLLVSWVKVVWTSSECFESSSFCQCFL